MSIFIDKILLRAWRLLALTLSAILFTSSSSMALTNVTGFSNPGALTMQKHIPSGLPSGAALVVVMHGCTQNGTEYHVNTGWKELADRFKFGLLVPSQTTSNNFNRCFNWWEPGDVNRGQGEGQSIINAIDKLVADHNIDASRVYVTGFSAGGGMTSVMIGSYPDRFKGAAIFAGLAYGCGNNLSQALACLNNPSSTNATILGNRVRSANPGYSGPWPTVHVFHGTSDGTVDDANMTAIVNQWTNVHGIDQIPENTSTTGTMTRRTYRKNGEAVVESFSFSGLGHAVQIDPGSADDKCGVSGQYYVDVNVCAPYVSAVFWGLTDSNAKPVVNSVSGSDGGSVVDVTADITDSDGTITAAVAVITDTASGTEVDSFSLSNAGGDTYTGTSGSLADGLYTIAVVATDNDGATSDPGSASVRIGPPPPPAPPQLSNIAVSVNGQCATVTGTVIDPNEDVSSVVVDFGGSNVTATITGTTYSAEGCGLPGGSNSAIVTATDAGGLQATDSISFTIVSGITATLTQHINGGRLSYGTSYASCYLEYGFGAFTISEKPNGSQCRWEDNDASCVGPVQACSTGNPPPPPPPPGNCEDHTTTNALHRAAGRATLQFFTFYYAVGSNDYIGLAAAITTLKSEDGGTTWSLGGC